MNKFSRGLIDLLQGAAFLSVYAFAALSMLYCYTNFITKPVFSYVNKSKLLSDWECSKYDVRNGECLEMVKVKK